MRSAWFKQRGRRTGRVALVGSVLALAGCGGWSAPPSYPVAGTVVDVAEGDRLVVDHEEIPGFMDAMVMPFRIDPASRPEALRPGDRVRGTLKVVDGQARLVAWEVVGHVDPEREARPSSSGPPPRAVHTGAPFPTVEIPVHGGDVWKIGEGAGRSTLLTFLYTRCPIPAFCPTTILRLQSVQAGVKEARDPGDEEGPIPRLLAVTIDPEHDTLGVLGTYAESVGADPAIWRFGRLPRAPLLRLAQLAGLEVYEVGEGQIDHNVRSLVLDADGVVIERYMDNTFDPSRVVRQLLTGRPRHDEGKVKVPFPLGGMR